MTVRPRHLLAVALLAACVLVLGAGQALAGQPTWRMVQLRGKAAKASLLDVSCGAAGSCVTVGSVGWSGSKGITLIDRNGHRSVHIQPAAGQSVSCRGMTWCTATGWTLTRTYAEYWNGVRWGPARTISGADPYGPRRLRVLCVSKSSCYAYGNQFVATTLDCPPDSVTGRSCDSYKPFLEHWDGRAWKVVAGLPSPAVITPRVPVMTLGPIAGLDSFACAGSRACVAVGSWSYGQARLNTRTYLYADIWNGGSWRLTDIPTPRGSTAALLSSVSCASANSCLAVGSYGRGGWSQYALAASWNGRRWSLVKPPGSAPRVALSSVSCVRHGQCLAVGSRVIGRGRHLRPMAVRWQAGRWVSERTPTPPKLRRLGGSFSAVSCATARFCEAIGSYFDSTSGGPDPLIERYAP